jgi:predicted nuclease of predicted toxin-antitoxin system
MRFLADMGVSQRVVTWLSEHGHEAVHLREEGLQRLENSEIFAKAFRERRIILTWDLDSAEILALSGTSTVSAVVFCLMNTPSTRKRPL